MTDGYTDRQTDRGLQIVVEAKVWHIIQQTTSENLETEECGSVVFEHISNIRLKSAAKQMVQQKFPADVIWRQLVTICLQDAVERTCKRISETQGEQNCSRHD